MLADVFPQVWIFEPFALFRVLLETIESNVAHSPRGVGQQCHVVSGREPRSAQRRFHDAMVVRAEAAIEHLDGIGLQNLEGQDRNLLNLLLALAEVTPAVVYYQAPFVAGGFDSRRMVPFDV